PRIPRSTGLSLVVVERLLDFLALVVLIALTLTGLTTVPPDIQSVMGLITIASILASIGLVLMVTIFQNLTRNIVIWLSERIAILKKLNAVRILDNVLLGFAMIRRPKFFALVMFWNVMAWACLVVAYYFLITALFPNATWAEATLFVVAAALAIIIPTTIASVGAIEGSAILALTSQGYSSEAGLALGLTLHLITLLSYTAPGLYGIWAETLTVSGILDVAEGHVEEIEDTSDAI
ncbi:MAG TPA: lysylphosphatidylglycerol synthase transmembrane domain-containing protein, partial [Aggregatilineales bacterium]|nr:lysylphosphatidylglycerol synthase transmembrane domain-containing protein [Aggregatilineales bacterium]